MPQDESNVLLYRQDNFPIFQNRMYDSKAEAISCPKGEIRLVENRRTGLVYNEAFKPELMTYDAHYQNEQAVSPQFRRHLESVLEIVDRCLGRKSLVEVGCGKGSFLEMLLEKGFEITGFDPTYEGSNPRVQRRYFTPELGIRGEGLILRHVLEHIQNPFAFLHRLKQANGGAGKIYIEVPCFDWICRRRVWFDIFYEHVNYFRLGDFHRMFGKVFDSGRLFGDQYLFVVADLATLREPQRDPSDAVRFPEDFVRRQEIAGGRTVIWGGASKGVIFALLMERSGQPVSSVIDINPAKQGKYLPATGLLVQSPEHALATLPKGAKVYVMNSNYLDEIRKLSGNAYTYVEVDHA